MKNTAMHTSRHNGDHPQQAWAEVRCPKCKRFVRLAARIELAACTCGHKWKWSEERTKGKVRAERGMK